MNLSWCPHVTESFYASGSADKVSERALDKVMAISGLRIHVSWNLTYTVMWEKMPFTISFGSQPALTAWWLESRRYWGSSRLHMSSVKQQD